MRRTLTSLTLAALALLVTAPALAQVRLPELDAATTPLGDDDLFLVRQDGETRDEKVTWANVRSSLQSALTLVLGPASACVDNQLARWNGASNTALQCSALTVADTTGDITAPGALTISTAGSNGDIVLDPNGTGKASVVQQGDSNGGLLLTYSGAPSDGVILRVGNDSGTPALLLANALGGEALLSLNSHFLIGNSVVISAPGLGSIVRFGSSYALGWSSAADARNNGYDTVLYRDAAATLAQRNSTNAQTYRLYSTYADASNYERLSFSTQAGTSGTIAMETAGTGADNLDLTIKPAGTGQLYVGAGGVTAASPVGAVVNATGGSGTDIAGASLTLAGGKGTGNANSGNVRIQTSQPGASGTTLQTLVDRFVAVGHVFSMADETAVDLWTAALPTNDTGCAVTMEFVYTATDATDTVTHVGRAVYAITNDGGTVTATTSDGTETVNGTGCAAGCDTWGGGATGTNYTATASFNNALSVTGILQYNITMTTCSLTFL